MKKLISVPLTLGFGLALQFAKIGVLLGLIVALACALGAWAFARKFGLIHLPNEAVQPVPITV